MRFRKTRFRIEMLFTIFFVAVFGFTLSQAFTFNKPESKVYPLVVTFLGLAFAVSALVGQFLEKREKEPDDKTKEGYLDINLASASREAIHTYRDTFKMIGGIAFLYLCLWLFGFLIAVGLFFIVILKVEARFGWLKTGAITALALLFFAFLQRVMNLYWAEGFIVSLFG